MPLFNVLVSCVEHCYCVQLFRFTLDPNQTWTVWPNELSMSSFVASGTAHSVIQLVVGKFCDDVRQMVVDVKVDIRSVEQGLITAFNALQDSLTAFQTKGNSLDRLTNS